MLGNAFAPTMRAAQAGDERAFARLWRDANPLVVRYLRVIGVEDPYDAACEGWVSIVRGVNALERDEKDWRLWVCSCARMCAEESSLRASWSPFRSRASVEATVDGSVDGALDDLDLDASAEESVTVVEWGQGLVEQLADEHLEVRLDRRDDDVRTAELVPHGAGWRQRLDGAQ